MLLLDSLFLSPFRGLMFVARRIDETIREERAAEATGITARLAELYHDLECHRISDEDFDHAEQALLDRLEHLRGNVDA